MGILHKNHVGNRVVWQKNGIQTDESINANKTCRTAQQHNTNEEPWPNLFFVVSGTALFIDFLGVLSVNENYLF